MNDSPFGILVSVGIAGVIGFLWLRDYRACRRGAGTAVADNEGSSTVAQPGTASAGAVADAGVFMPGATPCAASFLVFAITGALVLTLLETAGELALGISQEQRDISALFLAAMLAAAVTEEVVFRGCFIVEGRGRAVLLTSAFAASLAFALMHDFLWSHDPPEGLPWWEFWSAFSLKPSLKNFYSTGAVFVVGLYFYFLRFHSANAHRSLLPCIAAHALRNFSVFALKLAQGHVTSWF